MYSAVQYFHMSVNSAQLFCLLCQCLVNMYGSMFLDIVLVYICQGFVMIVN